MKRPSAHTGTNPAHIAIIMDGNGRWANRRGLDRSMGHQAGQQTLEKTVEWCIQRKIRYLTVYAFSTENWNRPAKEVRFLMKLIEAIITQKTRIFMKQGIRLRILGDIDHIPNPLKKKIVDSVEMTRNNKVFDLVVAFNYGGRDEIVRAARKWALSTPREKLSRLTEETFRSFLDHPDVPDPDLLIRPGGEARISNFLLWELSYSELWFTKTLWPDFSARELDRALRWFKARHRRFGGL
jgi:undecaprenyl diphosphate synthase